MDAFIFFKNVHKIIHRKVISLATYDVKSCNHFTIVFDTLPTFLLGRTFDSTQFSYCFFDAGSFSKSFYFLLRHFGTMIMNTALCENIKQYNRVSHKETKL